MNDRLPDFVQKQNEDNTFLQLDENPPEPVSSLSANQSFIAEPNLNFDQSFDPVSSSLANTYFTINSTNNSADASNIALNFNSELPREPEWNNNSFQNLPSCSSSVETKISSTNEIPLEPSQGDEFILSTSNVIQTSDLQHPIELIPTVLKITNKVASQNDLSTQQNALTTNNFNKSTPSSSTHNSNNLMHPSDPTKFHINNTLLTQILEYGFSEYIAILAIQRTKGVGLEQAINWIIDHSNASEIEKFDKNLMGSETSHLPNAESSKSSILQNSLKAANQFLNKVNRPYKMIFVANMGLKMGTGKLAAQVGHATLGVYRVAQKTQQGQKALDEWRHYGEVKIVVKGQNTEQLLDLFKQAKDANLYAYLVEDAGYTQIPPGSQTVLGIFGAAELIDKITGALKLL